MTLSPEDTRLRLLGNGYTPVPCVGKAPVLKAWQTLEPTIHEIKLWSRTAPAATNTGILTRTTPTLDIDILDPEAAAAVEDLAQERFEERGYVLVRVGRAPKRAIPFRTNEPFPKILVNFAALDGAPGEKLELLCDGQQFVAHRIHPDTGKPYSWHGGEPGEIEHEGLPYIHAEEAQALVDDATKLLIEKFEYRLRPAKAHKEDGNGAGGEPWSFTPDDLVDHDSLAAIAMKLVKSGMGAGAVINFLRSAVAGLVNVDEERRQRRLKEIPGMVASAVAKLRQQDRSPVTPAEAVNGVALDDFHAYMPMHSYIFAPSREMWPAGSVNARIPPIGIGDKKIAASTWLDQNRPVEQMTWVPGEPMLISGRLIADGGWIERNGVTCFNLYRPPTIELGDPERAEPWLDHAHKVFGDDAAHIIAWLAHRVQRPAEKINHALVLGGGQGIGKDTLLEPVKRAVGPWNVSEVSPQHMLGRFNGYLKSVILRVNEARDLGDVNRFQFYDHMKAYIASPPDVLRVDEKNLREYSVPNCCGVVITSNHKADGIYLPPDDRRHFVAWSDLTKEVFAENYWAKVWRYYDDGGDRHVAAYLAELDISEFDPKAPPPKTAAFWDIVDANRAPEDAELADVIDLIGNPPATTILRIADASNADLSQWITDRKNRRVIPHRLEKVGYVPVRNEYADDGLWKLNGKRQVIYAKSALSISDRFRAAKALSDAASGQCDR